MPKSTLESDPDRWESVCKSESTVVLAIESICERSKPLSQNPIDAFLASSTELVKIAQPPLFRDTPVLGRMLLLAHISAVELYFRSVFAQVVEACPLCKKTADGQMIALGATRYYRHNSLGMGVLEEKSFASSKVIKSVTSTLVPSNIDEGSSVGVALRQYESLCNLRHAIVHSYGYLNAKNAIALGVDLNLRERVINVTLKTYQEAALVCRSVVRSYNRFLYKELVANWKNRKIFHGEWKKDKAQFERLFSIFYSKHDDEKPRRAYDAYRLMRPMIRARLGLS